MYNFLIELVNSSQFCIDAVDLTLAFDYESLALAIEDLLFFNADMMAQMLSI